MNEFDRMFQAMDQLHSRLNNLFQDYGLFRPAVSTWSVTETSPRTNLYDVGDRLEVKVEVPGIAKGDLNVKIQGNYLEISGSRKSDTPKGYKAHRVERGETTFTRSFTLPAEIEASRVEAALKDGILTLRLPKVEKAQPIQIAIG
jgi:HSP20 family protein